MKKFLVMAALVVAAGYLVYHRLLPIWHKPANVAKTRDAGPPANGGETKPPPALPLTDGLQLVKDGKHAEAIPVLTGEIAELEKKGSDDAARHIAALARCYDATDKDDKAAEMWNRLIDRFPSSQEAVEGHSWLAHNALTDAERAKHHEIVLTSAGDSVEKHIAKMEEGLGKCDQPGKEYEAREALSRALAAGLPADKASIVKEAIGKLNEKLIWSRMKTPESIDYTVVAGDTLNRIALEHKTTRGLLMRINKLKNNRINPGNNFKLIPCDGCELRVSKTDLTLQLWLRGNFIKEYSVCVGDPDNAPTPEDTFTVTGRMEDPPWKGVPAGAPGNILGTRWMGVKEKPTYGVHGTTQPETIPGRKSAGCVRMLNSDVEEVYDFAIDGSKVIISP